MRQSETRESGLPRWQGRSVARSPCRHFEPGPLPPTQAPGCAHRASKSMPKTPWRNKKNLAEKRTSSSYNVECRPKGAMVTPVPRACAVRHACFACARRLGAPPSSAALCLSSPCHSPALSAPACRQAPALPAPTTSFQRGHFTSHCYRRGPCSRPLCRTMNPSIAQTGPSPLTTNRPFTSHYRPNRPFTDAKGDRPFRTKYCMFLRPLRALFLLVHHFLAKPRGGEVEVGKVRVTVSEVY